MLAISLDGRLSFSRGGKGNLGNRGDRKVLEEALAWSDATLMGSQTLKIHENTCLIHNKKLIKERLKEGRLKQPISIIVSNKASFSRELDFFDQPITRWLLSSQKTSEEISIKGFDKLLLMKNNWINSLKELNKEGLTKITILGGTRLITSLLSEDVIDELQLTVTPRIIGGKYTWTSYNLNDLPNELNQFNAWKIITIEELGNNELMLKYIRNRS